VSEFGVSGTRDFRVTLTAVAACPQLQSFAVLRVAAIFFPRAAWSSIDAQGDSGAPRKPETKKLGIRDAL
jgi:hypothetical protein